MLKVVVLYNLLERLEKGEAKDMLAEDAILWEMNIPALLDLFRIPYTGSSPLTLGLCLDKGKVKDILQSQGIPTPRYKIFDRGVNPIRRNSFPMIVKPLHEDGSLGF